MIFWSRVILKMQASFKKILLRLLNVCFMYMHTVQGPTYIYQKINEKFVLMARYKRLSITNFYSENNLLISIIYVYIFFFTRVFPYTNCNE